MPSVEGADSLGPEYAPWAYIGPDNEHFVWQTVKSAEHEGYLYRAGMVDDNQIVCERRPLEDVLLGSLMKRERVEPVPIELIPEGLFPSLETMSHRLEAVRSMVDRIDPTRSNSDLLNATIRYRQK